MDGLNRPVTDTFLFDGCDFEHWLVAMEKPEGNPSRDEIIDNYIKTLAQVVGRKRQGGGYTVSSRHYHAFGALVSKELAEALNDLEGVRFVAPGSYVDRENKDYRGEQAISKAVTLSYSSLVPSSSLLFFNPRLLLAISDGIRLHYPAVPGLV